LNRTLQILKYILSDAIGASCAYLAVFTFRKSIIEPKLFGDNVLLLYDNKFVLSLLAIVAFWLAIHTITGVYRNIYRRSRLREFVQTFSMSLLGSVFLFFAIILDDYIDSYTSYYQSFAILFGVHFVFTALGRLILSSRTAHRIHSRSIGFNTLLIGSNENALKLHEELQSQRRGSGFLFKGFVHINGGHNHALEGNVPHLGHFENINSILSEHGIEDAIIALETSEHDKIGQILNKLEGQPVNVKIIPNMYDILSGQVRMTSIMGAPLIDISHEIMPAWQQSFKRMMDVFISIFCLILLSPVYLIIGLIVKFTSKGPFLYSHERIGLHGKPFNIYKFRSMYQNAENNGPALSKKDDPRITPFGKFLRRSRLDELPQFYNVLKADMSMVGPRPERQFFIDKIVQVAPHYKHLQSVRPGITSWGQVKYGYAENVEQMVERLKFDVLYIENMSLLVDLKILIYTVLIVLQGRGK
jgi:exopolysaccharide biosynthesis polyprenyl glycosylphosphotransferase